MRPAAAPALRRDHAEADGCPPRRMRSQPVKVARRYYPATPIRDKPAGVVHSFACGCKIRSGPANQWGMQRVALLLIALLVWLPAPLAAAAGFVLAAPLPGRVVRGFDSVARYAAGHRGVDLEASVGELVRAPAVGVVRFAGPVGGVATISIDHGNGWRTTYQPVHALVAQGDEVDTGEVIGTMLAGHCAAQACLHWGLTDGVQYADPLAYSVTPGIRLVPRGTVLEAPPDLTAAVVVRGVSGMPVAGRRTSPFGMRRHPITGVWKLHDGTDLAAPCGTPIVAPARGVVTRAFYSPAYGWRVFLDHGGSLVTAYNHLPAIDVLVGQTIEAGGRLGRVGNTGLSTGCHLHWMAWRGGDLIDPLSLTGGG